MPAQNDLGAATIALGQTVGAFQFFLPRLSDVRKSTMDDVDMVGDVRMGEVAASALCIGIGAMVSSLSGSPYPALVSVLTAGVLVVLYETALRGNKPMNPVRPSIREE
jgi:hypothetical protein